MKYVLIVAAAIVATPAAAQTNPIAAFIEAVILSSKTHDGLQRKTPDRRPTAAEVATRNADGTVQADPDARVRSMMRADPASTD